MLNKGVHFGYSRSSRHPKMKDFLFELKNNTEIFDIKKTEQKLNEAMEFIKSLGKEQKKILFVATKAEMKKIIEKSAKEIAMPYVNERWIGGTLTNFKIIRARINYMNDLIKKRESGEFEKYTKKEQLDIKKKVIDLKRYFIGLETLESLPSALIVVDSKEERNAVAEANNISVPVVAIMNSDCDPEKINYVISANDNSVSSVEYLLGKLVEAYKDGLSMKQEAEIV
jgi:small subunit ribosomal protein S2